MLRAVTVPHLLRQTKNGTNRVLFLPGSGYCGVLSNSRVVAPLDRGPYKTYE